MPGKTAGTVELGNALSETEEYDIAAPRAEAMIHSLRAFGYDLPTALADLIDNSIAASAKNIWLEFYWDGAKSFVAVTDDGGGMSESALLDAMRPGSRSPLDIRDPSDLGRYGLGLKTASFSQAKRLTVGTKQGESPGERHESVPGLKAGQQPDRKRTGLHQPALRRIEKEGDGDIPPPSFIK